MSAPNRASPPAPRVSVLMPVYNGERFLAAAIDSILAQTFGDFEFIIVDDGSTDHSAAIISDYARRDGRIRSLRHQTNRGQSSALNTGLAAARGEFIAGMDADDISLPERLRMQVDFLGSHPAIGVVGAARQDVDAALQPIRAVQPPTDHKRIVFNLLFGMPSICGALAMTRRSLLSAVGGYTPDVVVNDWELLTRLAHRTRFANLPESLYRYRQHDSAVTVARQQEAIDDWQATQARWLQRLFGESRRADRLAPQLEPLRKGEKLPLLRLPQLHRDLRTLSQRLVATQTIDPEDRAPLDAEFASLLERAGPRLWLKALHWRRYRLGF